MFKIYLDILMVIFFSAHFCSIAAGLTSCFSMNFKQSNSISFEKWSKATLLFTAGIMQLFTINNCYIVYCTFLFFWFIFVFFILFKSDLSSFWFWLLSLASYYHHLSFLKKTKCIIKIIKTFRPSSTLKMIH